MTGALLAPRTPEPKVRRKERGKKNPYCSFRQFPTILPLNLLPSSLFKSRAPPTTSSMPQTHSSIPTKYHRLEIGKKKKGKKREKKTKKTSRVSMPQTHCIPSIVVKKKKKSQGVWIFFSLSPSLSLFHRSPFFLLIVVVVGCGCLLGVVWSHRWPCNLTPWRGLKIRALRAGSYICRYNNGVNGSITAAPAMFFFFFFLSSFPPPLLLTVG